MIKINKENGLTFILIISCIVPGVFGEAVFYIALFWGMLNALIYEKIPYSMRFAFIIISYISLMFICMYLNYPDITYRTVGLTKCMCGISICALLAPYICKSDVTGQLTVYAIIFNFLSFFSNAFGIEVGYTYLDIPGTNSAGCISLLILPHIICKRKCEIRLTDIIYFISLIFLNIGYISSTFVVCFFVIIFLNLLPVGKMHFTPVIRKVISQGFSLSAALLIIIGVVNDRAQALYYKFLEIFDIYRYQIIQQGVAWWQMQTSTKKILGTGDTIYFLRYGIPSEAHNFILETLILFGMAGVAVLVFDTYTFFKLIIFLKKSAIKFKCILLSVLVSYVYFMLHPFYTSSFIIKIFLIFYNMSIYYKFREDGSAQNFSSRVMFRNQAIKMKEQEVFKNEENK